MEIISETSNEFKKNPTDLVYKKIIAHAFSYDTPNAFIIFRGITNILYLIFVDDDSIYIYDLDKSQKISNIKALNIKSKYNSYNEYENPIINFRYIIDQINKRDLIISVFLYNKIKIWNINSLECICEIDPINNSGLCKSACFLNEKNQIYIVTSNDFGKDPIKIFDLKGNKVKELKNTEDNTHYIEVYFDKFSTKNYIISLTDSINAFDYESGELYHKYSDDKKGPNHITIFEKEKEVKIIEASIKPVIKIWDFHKGELNTVIPVEGNYCLSICLWNKQFLFASFGKKVKLIDLENKKSVNFVQNDCDVLALQKACINCEGESLIVHEGTWDLKLYN